MLHQWYMIAKIRIILLYFIFFKKNLLNLRKKTYLCEETKLTGKHYIQESKKGETFEEFIISPIVDGCHDG